MDLTQQDFISIIREYKGNLRETADEVILHQRIELRTITKAEKLPKIKSCRAK